MDVQDFWSPHYSCAVRSIQSCDTPVTLALPLFGNLSSVHLEVTQAMFWLTFCYFSSKIFPDADFLLQFLL